jgi:AcrR family transcriptional regulator
VFALKGYAAASMEDVALAAGCSKGGLYHHFPAKEHLLRAVVGRMAAEGTLAPQIDPQATGVVPAARLLLQIWAEATRDQSLRGQLTAAYGGPADGSDGAGVLDRVLAMGTLIQLLTRPEDADVAHAVAGVTRTRAA